MDSQACIFEYLYRDGGNFKTHGQLRLDGWDEGAEGKIRLCLEWGDQFVAEQVGVPPLCPEHWESVGEGPSDLDHAFHEFLCVRHANDEDADLPVPARLARTFVRLGDRFGGHGHEPAQREQAPNERGSHDDDPAGTEYGQQVPQIHSRVLTSRKQQ